MERSHTGTASRHFRAAMYGATKLPAGISGSVCDGSAAVGKMSDQDEARAKHPRLWKKQPTHPIKHICHAPGAGSRVQRMTCADGGQRRRPGAVPEQGTPRRTTIAGPMPREVRAGSARSLTSRTGSAGIPPREWRNAPLRRHVRVQSLRVWLTRRRDAGWLPGIMTARHRKWCDRRRSGHGERSGAGGELRAHSARDRGHIVRQTGQAFSGQPRFHGYHAARA